MPESASGNASALAQLCAAFGIAPDYNDIWGNRIAVPEANLVALLAEFCVDASTPERRAAALDAVQSAAWRDALPPVVAICAGAARWSLPLRLPEAATRLRWTLTEEGGARHQGEADAADLPESARAEVGGRLLRERRLELALALPAGYHSLTIEGLENKTLVIAAPAHCYRPPALAEGGRIWGPALQLYALRSERNCT